MIKKEMDFFNPNTLLRRLYTLMEIDEQPSISQLQLAKSVGLSSSMANNYIKDLTSEKLIRMVGKTNRSMRYYLTKKGEKEKEKLLISFSTEIIQLYTAAKQALAKRLMKFHKDGIKKAVIFGAAETGEVVVAASKKIPIKIVGVVDNDKEKQGKNFHGLKIKSPKELNKMKYDGIIITSFGKQKDIYNQIRDYEKKGIPVKRL